MKVNASKKHGIVTTDLKQGKVTPTQKDSKAYLKFGYTWTILTTLSSVSHVQRYLIKSISSSKQIETAFRNKTSLNLIHSSGMLSLP
jgi:hypothetical protein